MFAVREPLRGLWTAPDSRPLWETHQSVIGPTNLACWECRLHPEAGSAVQSSGSSPQSCPQAPTVAVHGNNDSVVVRGENNSVHIDGSGQRVVVTGDGINATYKDGKWTATDDGHPAHIVTRNGVTYID